MTHATTDVTDLEQQRHPARVSIDDGAPRSAEPSGRRQARSHRPRSAFSRGLSWFSVGIGLGHLIAPKRLARLMGLSARPRTLNLMRALGGALVAAGSVALIDAWTGRRFPAKSALTGRKPIRRSMTIARSPAEVYRFWRDFQNLPKFMVHLESVETLDATHSYWRARSVGKQTFEWNAEIVEDRPNELIRWRTMSSSQVTHEGVVRFVEAPGGRGTEIHVGATYEPPGGPLGRAIALVFGKEPSQQIEGDLRRLKQVMEVGEVIESDASVHRGAHPARPSVAPRIRKHGGQP